MSALIACPLFDCSESCFFCGGKRVVLAGQGETSFHQYPFSECETCHAPPDEKIEVHQQRGYLFLRAHTDTCEAS